MTIPKQTEGLRPAGRPRIFLLDDDPAYCEQLSAYLELQGYTVLAALDATRLESCLADFAPDLVLLDQRLGQTTGTEVLKRMRQHSNVPCIVVTGLSDPLDRIVNLEVGADDEIEKLVAPRELLARIRAVLRRGARTSPPETVAEAAAPTEGGWNFLISKRELRRPDGSVCHLTSAEFELLRLLHEAAGAPVSRATLSERVFGRTFAAHDRAVDTAVNKLRRKLEPGSDSTVIKSVRPIGYVFAGFPR